MDAYADYQREFLRLSGGLAERLAEVSSGGVSAGAVVCLLRRDGQRGVC
jgi:hypothetical protein